MRCSDPRASAYYWPPASTTDERDHGALGGQRSREILDRMLIMNAAHLRKVLAEYESHFKIIRRDRLGGLLHEYTQVA
jgi:hypothetical protein